MSVLPPLDPAAATGKTKELFTGLLQRLGRAPNMTRIMAHAPAMLDAYLQFTYAMQHTTVSSSLRNQLALAVAAATGSPYFLALATALAGRDGLDPAEIAAARQADSRDQRAAVALRLAAAMVREQGHVPAEDVVALRQAGFSDEAVVEIVSLIGLNIFRSYFNLALGTELDTPSRREAVAGRRA